MYRQPMSPPLLVSGVDGMVRAHEMATGRRVWEYSVVAKSDMSVVRVVVHATTHVVAFASRRTSMFGDYEGVLAALDYTTGRPFWQQLVPGPFLAPTLLVEPPYVFLAHGPVLAAFALGDGRFLWHDESICEVASGNTTTSVALATPNATSPADRR